MCLLPTSFTSFSLFPLRLSWRDAWFSKYENQVSKVIYKYIYIYKLYLLILFFKKTQLDKRWYLGRQDDKTRLLSYEYLDGFINCQHSLFSIDSATLLFRGVSTKTLD